MKARIFFVAIFFISTVNLSYGANTEENLKIGKIEIIEGKTQVKKVETIDTDFHGKKIKSTREEKINQKSVKGNPQAKEYLKTVEKTIYQFYKTPKKLSEKIHSGEVKVKLQIQASGRYDILFISGNDQFLKNRVDNIFYEISSFPPIPVNAGISEFQIEIPFKFHFKLNIKPKGKK